MARLLVWWGTVGEEYVDNLLVTSPERGWHGPTLA